MIGDGMLKHVRSLDKSKEKIIDIKGNSFHSMVMDVVKVAAKMKEQKGASFPRRSKMANPNLREEPSNTFISKARAIQW
jgi:hypothetical protein